MRAVKAAATAATFTALVVGVGGAAFLLTNEDSATPPTTTTISQAPPTEAELAAAIATGLADGLEVPLTPAQAGCVADVFLTTVGGDAVAALASAAAPLDALTAGQREDIVRGIVACVPSEVAAALLGTPTTVITVAPVLPDEGSTDG